MPRRVTGGELTPSAEGVVLQGGGGNLDERRWGVGRSLAAGEKYPGCLLNSEHVVEQKTLALLKKIS